MDPQDPPGLAWCPIRRAWLPRDWVVQEQPQPDPRDAELARLRAENAALIADNEKLVAVAGAEATLAERLRAALLAGREWLEVVSPPPPGSISGRKMAHFRRLLLEALPHDCIAAYDEAAGTPADMR